MFFVFCFSGYSSQEDSRHASGSESLPRDEDEEQKVPEVSKMIERLKIYTLASYNNNVNNNDKSS